MGRKKTFKPVPVRGETKDELDKLKRELEKIYNDPTYDDLMTVMIRKHEKIAFKEREIQDALWGIRRKKKI